MTTRDKKIRVFDYTDYRKYLLDYYSHCKKTKPGFSYRYFSQHAGLNSIGLYKDVIEGRQLLGERMIDRFSEGIGHNEREAEYFKNMVLFCQAEAIDIKKKYFSKMLACCRSRAAKVDIDQCEYYARCYYSAERIIIGYDDFDGNYETLASTLCPHITIGQCKKAIKVLQNLGFIHKDHNGNYHLSQRTVTSGPISIDSSIRSLNVIGLQRIMVDLGKKAYDQFTHEKINMSSLTLGVSESTYRDIKREIEVLREKFLLMAKNDSNADRVYQLNYQFFPLTEIDGKKK